MKVNAIYTEKNNCQDCYKCIRECPAKAIKIEDNIALILDELCVYCGHCVETCPVGAKKVRQDIDTVRYYFDEGKRVIAALAPSYVAEFGKKGKQRFYNKLREFGFSEIVEVAEGAGILNDKINEYIEHQGRDIYISSCCPSIVMMIRKYYPRLTRYLLPFNSPMIIEGALLREKYPSDTRIVFIGPCIAKKKEAELFPGYIDVVLTFQEIADVIDFDDQSAYLLSEKEYADNAFNGGISYPLPGGMITGMKKIAKTSMNYLSIDGLEHTQEFLESIDQIQTDEPLFVELTACEGSCLNGPGSLRKATVVQREIELQNYVRSTREWKEYKRGGLIPQITTNYGNIPPVTQIVPSEDEIESLLASIGKKSEKDRLNCGSCGYETCYKFAIANIRGKAERKMCVSYMRNVAHNKATVLLRKMPYGVIMVDENLRIIESNSNFASLLGPEVEKIFEVAPGLEGVKLSKLGEFYKYFKPLLISDTEYIEKEIRINKKLVKLSIFTIQREKILCGIFNNLTVPQIRKEEVVKRTRQVIQDYLATVQHVAFLLGENASLTEASLSKIVEVYHMDDEDADE